MHALSYTIDTHRSANIAASCKLLAFLPCYAACCAVVLPSPVVTMLMAQSVCMLSSLSEWSSLSLLDANYVTLLSCVMPVCTVCKQTLHNTYDQA